MQRKGRMAASIVAALGLAALAGGCASIKDHRGYLADAALVESVQPGIDNQTSVERSLGRPTFISQFGEKYWYYVSIDTKQAAFTRSRPSGQMVMRIRFDEKGNVAEVNRFGMEHVVRLNPDGKKTPTLGKERTFLEDLFGNIGTVGAPGASPQGGGGPGSGPNGS